MRKTLTKINDYRNSIMDINNHNFDIEASDTIRAIQQSPDKEYLLLLRLWKQAMIYRTFDMSKRPPKLLRLKNETSEQYRDRCYEKINKTWRVQCQLQQQRTILEV